MEPFWEWVKDSTVPLLDICSQFINSAEYDGDGVPDPGSSSCKTQDLASLWNLCDAAWSGLPTGHMAWRSQPTHQGGRSVRGMEVHVATAGLVVVCPEALVLGLLLPHLVPPGPLVAPGQLREHTPRVLTPWTLLRRTNLESRFSQFRAQQRGCTELPVSAHLAHDLLPGALIPVKKLRETFLNFLFFFLSFSI